MLIVTTRGSSANISYTLFWISLGNLTKYVKYLGRLKLAIIFEEAVSWLWDFGRWEYRPFLDVGICRFLYLKS
jgi:hypothetical protein